MDQAWANYGKGASGSLLSFIIWLANLEEIIINSLERFLEVSH